MGLSQFLIGCHNAIEPQLPLETTTGQHTFGCLVNGQVWIPSGKILLGRSFLEISYEPAYHEGTLEIRANIDNYQKAISFVRTGISQQGSYQLRNDSTSFIVYRDESLASPCLNFSTNVSHPEYKISAGQLIVTRIDLTGNGVVAGRFWFTLEQPGCEPIYVTDGRFDMPLN